MTNAQLLIQRRLLLFKLNCLDKAFYWFADQARWIVVNGRNEELAEYLYVVGFSKLQRVEAIALTQLNTGVWDVPF